MEVKIKAQTVIMKMIKTLNINFGKHRPVLKTHRYIVNRLFKLDELWLEFQLNHTQILELKSKDIPYFEDSIYEKVKQLYESTKSRIELWAKTHHHAKPLKDQVQTMETTSASGGGTPVITSEMDSIKSTSEEQHLELQRRLLKELLTLKREGIEKVWPHMKRRIGCHCKRLWKSMHKEALEKLAYLFRVGDRNHMVPEVARMSTIDWEVIDTVLAYYDVDVIAASSYKNCDELRCLSSLFDLVQLFDLENMTGEELARTWVQATMQYNSSERSVTPMLLQRRWFELKRDTRRCFYEYWSHYNESLKYGLNNPSPIHISIAKRYPHIITTTFDSWKLQLESGRVAYPHMIEQAKSDLQLIEPVVETFDHELERHLESEKSPGQDTTLAVEKEKSDLEQIPEDFYMYMRSDVPIETTIEIEPDEPVDVAGQSHEADLTQVVDDIEASNEPDGLINVKIVSTAHVGDISVADTTVDADDDDVILLPCDKDVPNAVVDSVSDKVTSVSDVVDSAIGKAFGSDVMTVVEDNNVPLVLDPKTYLTNRAKDDDIIMLPCDKKFTNSVGDTEVIDGAIDKAFGSDVMTVVEDNNVPLVLDPKTYLTNRAKDDDIIMLPCDKKFTNSVGDTEVIDGAIDKAFGSDVMTVVEDNNVPLVLDQKTYFTNRAKDDDIIMLPCDKKFANSVGDSDKVMRVSEVVDGAIDKAFGSDVMTVVEDNNAPLVLDPKTYLTNRAKDDDIIMLPCDKKFANSVGDSDKVMRVSEVVDGAFDKAFGSDVMTVVEDNNVPLVLDPKTYFTNRAKDDDIIMLPCDKKFTNSVGDSDKVMRVSEVVDGAIDKAFGSDVMTVVEDNNVPLVLDPKTYFTNRAKHKVGPRSKTLLTEGVLADILTTSVVTPIEDSKESEVVDVEEDDDVIQLDDDVLKNLEMEHNEIEDSYEEEITKEKQEDTTEKKEEDIIDKIDKKLLMTPLVILTDMKSMLNKESSILKLDKELTEKLIKISKKRPNMQYEQEEELAKLKAYIVKIYKNAAKIKRHYTPISLCKNPDFNTRLKRISASFLISAHNRRILNECKPLTIDLFNCSSSKINTHNVVDNSIDTSKFKEIPLPASSLIKLDINVTEDEREVTNTRRPKSVMLQDIDEIRRINSKIQTAEVPPITQAPYQTALEEEKSHTDVRHGRLVKPAKSTEAKIHIPSDLINETLPGVTNTSVPIERIAMKSKKAKKPEDTLVAWYKRHRLYLPQNNVSSEPLINTDTLTEMLTTLTKKRTTKADIQFCCQAKKEQVLRDSGNCYAENIQPHKHDSNEQCDCCCAHFLTRRTKTDPKNIPKDSAEANYDTVDVSQTDKVNPEIETRIAEATLMDESLQASAIENTVESLNNTLQKEIQKTALPIETLPNPSLKRKLKLVDELRNEIQKTKEMSGFVNTKPADKPNKRIKAMTTQPCIDLTDDDIAMNPNVSNQMTANVSNQIMNANVCTQIMNPNVGNQMMTANVSNQIRNANVSNRIMTANLNKQIMAFTPATVVINDGHLIKLRLTDNTELSVDAKSLAPYILQQMSQCFGGDLLLINASTMQELQNICAGNSQYPNLQSKKDVKDNKPRVILNTHEAPFANMTNDNPKVSDVTSIDLPDPDGIQNNGNNLDETVNDGNNISVTVDDGNNLAKTVDDVNDLVNDEVIIVDDVQSEVVTSRYNQKKGFVTVKQFAKAPTESPVGKSKSNVLGDLM